MVDCQQCVNFGSLPTICGTNPSVCTKYKTTIMPCKFEPGVRVACTSYHAVGTVLAYVDEKVRKSYVLSRMQVLRDENIDPGMSSEPVVVVLVEHQRDRYSPSMFVDLFFECELEVWNNK